MDVAMVVFVGGGVVFTGTVLDLCVAVLVVAFGLKSTEGPCGVLTPESVPLMCSSCVAVECWYKLSYP